jgi:hypothetical protein
MERQWSGFNVRLLCAVLVFSMIFSACGGETATSNANRAVQTETAPVPYPNTGNMSNSSMSSTMSKSED